MSKLSSKLTQEVYKLDREGLQQLEALCQALLDEQSQEPEEASEQTPAQNGKAKSRGYRELKTINGKKYWYRRWREGKKLKSEYIGPA